MMGATIKELREKIGYSQVRLADESGITRQSIIKYETGKAELTVDAAKKLASVLGVNYINLIEDKMPEEYTYEISEPTPKQDKSEFRISVPAENIEKFKQVLLYILKNVGAKPNVGQTVIYKLLYFIDFDYYELYEEQLIGARYIKNTFGPTPVDFAKIVKSMENEGLLTTVSSKYFNKEQTKYLPRVEPDLTLLNARELEHINNIIRKHSDKNAAELSELSHKDIPWIGAKDNELIDYEAVFYRNDITSVRSYESDCQKSHRAFLINLNS